MRFAKPHATLVGFLAPLAHVLNASQVPVTFRPRHLQGLGIPSWQLLSSHSYPFCGSASEVLPSEVSPFAAQVPVSGARPSCRWRRVSPRLQGSHRRRSVGAAAPRASPGVPPSRAFKLVTHRGLFRATVPPCAWPPPSEEGGAAALRGLFCDEFRFPLSR